MLETTLNEMPYRYSHTHKGIRALAPEFWATSDEDAVSYLKILKGIPSEMPYIPCCNGEKLERLQPGVQSGDITEPDQWIEVRLTEG